MAEAEKPIGLFHWNRSPTFYETFMEEQGIPIVRGIGLYDSREVTLAPWKRMGGQGAFIQLDGTGGITGMYLLEIPAGGSVNPERHVYEELFWVVEGRGTTEIWIEGSSKKQTFEWQAGSLFAIPLNTWHRLVNATSSPALVLGVNNAPPVMELYRNQSFIFDNPFHFSDRYDESDDYFKPREFEREPDSGGVYHPELNISGRHVNRSSLIPDTANCELPLDGQMSPGNRIFLMGGWSSRNSTTRSMAGTTFRCFLAQYPSGRYTKCHYHEGGPVLLCVRGKGYTLTWGKELGLRPWESGNGHLVKRQDYVPGGMVSAAPGGTDWLHGHFGASKEGLRILAFSGGEPRRVTGAPGDAVISHAVDIKQGGNTVEFRDEDPQIRKDFVEALTREEAEFHMPGSVYQ